ncbi:AAA family ATPase [Pseudothermotoga thermarum]|uniref:ATPase associated with various cellular activities AAA_3 n=1 Tax=Pseudothermotoga thermarum DSM 5069 TaxID=688269 RepID=F7YVI6_9THEM|nr:MoxR family ATPase [Pseudothermotoga thermarum]AEH51641.1 ATPase associated with various cellular activities AAA_3 [Pseudothermotoga thermarum DSM 5069]
MATLEKFARKIIENVSKVIVGKEDVIKKILAAMLSDGHVLLNDVPGVGKTMLARSLAASINLSFNRIQCTPDLLPSDVTGLNILDTKQNEFVFKKGPIFTDIILVDEINRATPRTQSALLQAMAEKQVTVDGVTYHLSPHFFVIATQNPIEFEGTFPLPEAQLDRFAICLSVGYPEKDQEIEMLKRLKKVHPIETIGPVCDVQELQQAKEEVKNVYVDESILDYIIRIVKRTRNHEDLALGASPRGAIALMQLSRAIAAMNGRNYVLPDDVKSIAIDVLAHRIILKPEARLMRKTKQDVLNEILQTEEAPVKGEA